jgi:Domain of unknown function (DUF5010)/DUF5010 C-terminal domain
MKVNVRLTARMIRWILSLQLLVLSEKFARGLGQQLLSTTTSETVEDIVDRRLDSRWRTLEEELKAELIQHLERQIGLAAIESENEDGRHDDGEGRRLQKITLQGLNTAIQQLRRRVSAVEVSVATLMDEVDAEQGARQSALASLRSDLNSNVQRLGTDLAGLQDEIDAEIETRETEDGVVKQSVALLQDQVESFCYPSNATEDKEDPLCYVPTAKSVMAETKAAAQVRPRDTILVRPPVRAGLPIIAPITAYTWRGTEFEGVNTDLYERPMYRDVMRDSDDFWKYIVDELLLARVPVALLGSRGCDDPLTGDKGPGNMCPRLLRKFVAAVQTAKAENVIRVGMFDPTGAYRDRYDSPLDLSNQTNWEFFWSYNMQIFFDTIPRNLWFLYQGQPLVTFWTLRDTYFSNQRGKASLMLAWLKDKFFERYGVEPLFILQDSWFTEDPAITPDLALGQHGWFKPVHDVPTSIYSYVTYNGKKWGVTTPGFRNGEAIIGCGDSCREVTRRSGTTLINALNAGKDATMVMLEGWTDMLEGAGFYRSEAWDYPTEYINIVRRYADPQPATLRFEAEGADTFFDKTPGNAGGEYALRNLDVGALPNSTGWYVGWIEAGEWIEFRRIRLGCGRYRFTARVATAGTGKVMRLVVNGRVFSRVALPATGGLETYGLVHMGEFALKASAYNLRVFFETAGLNLDWIFVRRVSTVCRTATTQKSQLGGRRSLQAENVTTYSIL